MIITRKSMNRRTLLRGTGAVLALPLMEAMMPASSVAAEAQHAARKRLHVIYAPNGMQMENWTPAKAGATGQPTAPAKVRAGRLLTQHTGLPPRQTGAPPPSRRKPR